jgi:hypothetical protein
MKWLPDMDLNHDKQIQSLLCYRYTIGQTEASGKLKNFAGQSSGQTAEIPLNIYARPHPGPMTRSLPLARPSAGLRFQRIPFVASQATQVPRGEGEVAPALGKNHALRTASAFHATRNTQYVS